MELTGEQRIAASRAQVWEALNDPEILRQCIPGCETLEKLSDTEFTADVIAKVGPVKAKFKGHVTLSDLDPPNGYTLSGEGKGGAAGFSKGAARVTLEEDGEDTVLRYTVDAKVGGKLAQIGSRLVDGTARKMADEFFSTFKNIVSAEEEALVEEIPETVKEELEAEAVPALAEKAGKSNLLLWGLVMAAIVIAVLLYLSQAG